MTDDDVTYQAIYAVADASIRTALLRLFAQQRSEYDKLIARIGDLEADAHTRDLAIGFGRWIGPMIVGLAAAVIGLLG